MGPLSGPRFSRSSRGGEHPLRRRSQHQAAAAAHSQLAQFRARPRSLPQPVSADFRQAETSGHHSKPQTPPAGRTYPTGTPGSGLFCNIDHRHISPDAFDLTSF
ncbi:hypothetical protein NDU88_003566 [Pleurodeles waltl]|uniref:Uncharacterized protein n=1 Tax=Pleurodeles waltl TaxID=8319 RepID=A0AAV7T5F9_PLEWA|nr:hypothetical protein NDU88_003566 [Pleurodeles waltl]